jgi:hypothetical protein
MSEHVIMTEEQAEGLWTKLVEFTNGLSQPEQVVIAAILHQAAQWAENNDVSGYAWPTGWVSTYAAPPQSNIVKTQEAAYKAIANRYKG